MPESESPLTPEDYIYPTTRKKRPLFHSVEVKLDLKTTEINDLEQITCALGKAQRELERVLTNEILQSYHAVIHVSPSTMP